MQAGFGLLHAGPFERMRCRSNVTAVQSDIWHAFNPVCSLQLGSVARLRLDTERAKQLLEFDLIDAMLRDEGDDLRLAGQGAPFILNRMKYFLVQAFQLSHGLESVIHALLRLHVVAEGDRDTLEDDLAGVFPGPLCQQRIERFAM